jgi:hypothetical protein
MNGLNSKLLVTKENLSNNHRGDPGNQVKVPARDRGRQNPSTIIDGKEGIWILFIVSNTDMNIYRAS